MKRLESCPNTDELERLLSGDATDGEVAALESHLSVCAECCRRIDSLAQHSALEDDLHWAASVRSTTCVTIGESLAKLNELLPDYEILREIGRGGMGIVYLANQPRLNRQVAIKVLPALLGVIHPEARERFRREAELAGGLDHTNIISIHDYGEADGTLYYAMQLIKGRSLRALLDEIKQTGVVDCVSSAKPLARGRAPGGSGGSGPTAGREYYLQVAHWIAEVADALQYAHARGIIHRDIKPSNLLLTEDGKLMISDFGLARLAGAQSLTATHSIVGTCRYMAPEQLRPGASEADHLVDIYALGATLYELLVFRPMFSGPDDRSVIHQIGSKDPTPPHRISKHVPRELETICLKAVAKERGSRYASAGEFANDLRRWSLDLPIGARRSSLPVRVARAARRHRVAVTCAGLSVAFAVVAGGMWIKYTEASRAETAARTSESLQRARTLVHQADLLINDESYEAAIVTLDESLALSGDVREAVHAKAIALARLGRRDDARDLLRGQTLRDGADWRSRYLLGMLLHDGHNPLGRSRSAQTPRDEGAAMRRSAEIGALLADVDRLRPGSPEAFCLRSAIEPDHAEAVALLGQALAIDTGFTDARVERAVRLGCMGRYNEALADLDAAIAARHGGHRLFGLRGIALYELGRWAEAEAACSGAIERNPRNIDWWYNRAVTRTYTRAFAGAIEDATHAIALDDNYAEAFVARGRGYAGVGRVDEALADYTHAASLDPSMADIYVERGLLLWSRGDYVGSLADANTLIGLEPRRTRGYQRRAQTYLMLGQWDDALADLDACDRIDPNDFATPTIRGGVYFYSGRYEEAARAFAAGQLLRPRDFGNYSFHALSRIRLGEYHAALTPLTEWIALANNADLGRMRRGMVFEALGDWRLALEDYGAAGASGRLGFYPDLWSGILLSLEGDTRGAETHFAACDALVTESSWEATLLETVRGRLPPRSALDAATTPSQVTEAQYYAGIAHLLRGEPSDVIASFEAATQRHDSDTFERDFAGVRLRMLREGPRSGATESHPGADR